MWITITIVFEKALSINADNHYLKDEFKTAEESVFIFSPNYVISRKVVPNNVNYVFVSWKNFTWKKEEAAFTNIYLVCFAFFFFLSNMELYQITWATYCVNTDLCIVTDSELVYCF